MTEKTKHISASSDEGIEIMKNKIRNFRDNTNNVTLTLTRDELFEIGLSLEIEIDNFNQRISSLKGVLEKVTKIQKEKVS
tara:strand:+ start:1489 stop:1728 length:240 start_codon:yes stop_codon:yes gene_type:complete